MKKVVLIFVVIAVTALLTMHAAGAPTPSERAVFPEKMVTNLCPFPIFVEFRPDGMGMVQTVTCPPFGTDSVSDLYTGGYMVMVMRTDTGVMFTEKHITLLDVHSTIKIHSNGTVTLHH